MKYLFQLVVILLPLTNILHIYYRCSNIDEEEDKEVGWKYIHGDVFRCPPNMSLFSAVLGTGTQLLTV